MVLMEVIESYLNIISSSQIKVISCSKLTNIFNFDGNEQVSIICVYI